MLTALSIRNIVLIEALDLEFDSGLGVLTGETGAGKTAAVKFMAHLTNRPLRRVNLHDQTDETELFGGYVPGADGGFVWKDGVITSAIIIAIAVVVVFVPSPPLT